MYSQMNNKPDNSMLI